VKTEPFFLGIDFGTTNSSAAVVFADPRHATSHYIPVRELTVTMDGDNDVAVARMPTVLSTRFDDKRQAQAAWGWQVFNLFGLKKRLPLVRRGQQLFESVKSDLGSNKIYAHSALKECVTPKQAATKILQGLLENIRKSLPPADLKRVRTVITVPASLSASAREETLEAAAGAGLNRDLIELIDEPVAALLHLLNEPSSTGILSTEEKRNILVLDYGGGTLDLCLVRASYDLDAPTGIAAEHLAISRYQRNGGNNIDGKLMEKVVWPQVEAKIEKKKASLPVDLRRAIEDTLTPTVARRLKERICKKMASVAQDAAELDQLADDLSADATAEAQFTHDLLEKPITGRFRITKSEFEEAVMGYEKDLEPREKLLKIIFDNRGGSPFNSLLSAIDECLEVAGLEAEHLHSVVLHGGSCRNPFVSHHLQTYFGDGGDYPNAILYRTPNLDTSVACGAALACYWRHEREVELVRPITAEEIGIRTNNLKDICLIESGVALPLPAEGFIEHPTTFFVPQDNQKTLLVPFYIGNSPETRRLSGTVSLPLPEGVSKGDTVRLKLSVDRDKIMHWYYSVGFGEFRPAESLENPWLHRQPSLPEQQLYDFRQEMGKQLGQPNGLPDWMLVREANLLRSAGDHEEAELHLLDFAHGRTMTAEAANILALTCFSQGRKDEALHYHETAARLKPTDPVLVGNYGHRLVDAGRIDEGIAKMREALSIDPNLSYLYENLGAVARKRGDEVGALKEFRRAIEVLQSKSAQRSADPEFWNELARLYRSVGDYDEEKSAKQRATIAHKDKIFKGDHRQVIAGPDSGLFSESEVQS
jgi:molecular chaperone DnaK (HSP70)/Flp pilus assembly protein TadD